MLRLCESLAGMGAEIDDRDFFAIILASLPESYRPLLSSINAAAKITTKPLSPYELINIISKEYEHRLLTDKRTSKKGSGTALAAKGTSRRSRNANSSSKVDQDITCFNCERKGHYKTDCWHPGGGKEGQGPNQSKRGSRASKQTANAAAQNKPSAEYAFVTSDFAAAARKLNVPAERRRAIVDLGATSHFCPDRFKFLNFVTISPQDIHTADGSTISAIG
jgi:hypothetical protein